MLQEAGPIITHGLKASSGLEAGDAEKSVGK